MAPQPAILGRMRLGNFRLGYKGPESLDVQRRTRARILIDGVDVRARTRMAGLTVHDIINDAPNTCALTVQTTEPGGAQALRVTVNSNDPVLLFDGALQKVGKTYELKPAQVVFPCTAIDDGARAKRRRPFGTWTNVSATIIAQYLVAVFMPGFTSHHVEAGLPAISLNLDGSEGINGAFTLITRLIGGYFFFEDLDVYLFTDAAAISLDLPLDVDDTPGRFLDDPPISVTTDDSQLVTRYFGKGHREQLLADVLAGETVIPVSNAAAWFGTVNPGGSAITNTQRLEYTGVQAGGAGSLVGPGTGPATAPLLTVAAGAGLGTGFYAYGITDTSTGESLLGPLAVIQTGASVANPAAAPTLQNSAPAGFGTWWAIGDSIYIVVTYLNAVGETIASAVSNTIVAAQAFGSFPVDLDAPSLPISSDPAVVTKKIYVNINGAWAANGTLSNANSNRFNLSQNGVIAPSGAAPPGANSTAGNQVAIAGIAIGAPPTTGRKVYRSAVQATAAAALAAPLKLQQTIANNSVTVGVQDATADGSLGADAPTSDTSGIAQAAGQVLAGSTSLLVAGAGAFAAGGGWAVIGNGTLVVRYTGIAGNTLTGIPPSGPGSLAATVAYNSTVTAAPVLTGVTGVVIGLVKGAPINVWVQRDDLAAQAEAAVRDDDEGEGIHEAPPIVDERRGEASLAALCDANLIRFSRPIITVVHGTRDMNAKSGKPQVFNVTTPAIHATLTIQDVVITEIDLVPGLAPKRVVTSSSVRFSLESLLQKMAANL